MLYEPTPPITTLCLMSSFIPFCINLFFKKFSVSFKSASNLREAEFLNVDVIVSFMSSMYFNSWTSCVFVKSILLYTNMSWMRKAKVEIITTVAMIKNCPFILFHEQQI